VFFFILNVKVAKYLGEPLSEINNVRSGRRVEDEPQKILPRGLSDERTKELDYFENYLTGIHQDFISLNY